MNNNIVDIKDKKTLVRLLRNCYYVLSYHSFNRDEGQYIKLQKTDLTSQLLGLELEIDMSKFHYDTYENIVYIN